MVKYVLLIKCGSGCTRNCNKTNSGLGLRNRGAERNLFERKILRRIFGPTKEKQIWRVKTNEELDNLINH
jgi:hypothetical protein